MGERRTYRTRQRELLEGCLAEHEDRYLTVRDIEAILDAAGTHVGATTLYRNLEQMVERGEVTKFIGTGSEARYRKAGASSYGQLVCLDCGGVEWLECDMLGAFSMHVRSDHGFAMEPSKVMLYGHCAACRSLGEVCQ